MTWESRNMNRRTMRNRRGAAVVELAFVLPLLITLLLGVWEVGRLVQVQRLLESAANEGGRQSATGMSTEGQVRQVVMNYLRTAGLPIGNATVTVRNLLTPGTDPTEAAQMDPLQVTVTMPFRDVRWSAATLVTSSASQLTSRVTWRSAKARPYPTSITPPAGY
jgi:Flp pilus assembly protein TadG